MILKNTNTKISNKETIIAIEEVKKLKKDKKKKTYTSFAEILKYIDFLI